MDSGDWKQTTAPYLCDFENVLKCNICKENYTAPVITGCNHTFCSLCIRRLLQTDTSCPICRTSIQSGMLRKNQAVEDIIEQWVKLRNQLLVTVSSVESKEEITSKDNEQDIEEQDIAHNGSSSDPGIRRSKRRKVTPDYTEIPASQDGIGKSSPDEYGECPVCGKHMKIKDIETTHIASCLAGSSSLGGSLMPFVRPKSGVDLTKRLPVKNYSIMKQAELKKTLLDAGLAVTGSRQDMEYRHREWVTLWNANADLKVPESKEKLLKKIQAWEAANKAQEKAKAAGNSTEMNDIKKIDGAQWKVEHRQEFADLIAIAKSNVKKPEAVSK